MGGPRITTGDDSKQDYGTPDDFLGAVKGQFGPIAFDLAAHRMNNKHASYFAPPNFIVKYDPDEDEMGGKGKSWNTDKVIESLVLRGALEEEARPVIGKARIEGKKTEIIIPNRDKNACEFSDIEPWAVRFKDEAKKGANGLLLTPAAVGSNWFRNHVGGVADVHILNGRLCFDGKNVFPKDCILSHFHREAKGDICVWEWKKNMFWRRWRYNA